MIRTGDPREEKHVPVIDCPERVKRGQRVPVSVEVGKHIPHPNTPEHHIAWIELYFVPDGEETPYPLGRAEFLAHGKDVVSPPKAVFCVELQRSGKLVALALCNIHGLWMGEKRMEVV